MPRTAFSDRSEKRERLDRMLATERDDISDTTLANDPQLPSDRIDALDPTDRIDPTLPIDRIDPTDPIDRSESLEPTDHRLFATPTP